MKEKVYDYQVVVQIKEPLLLAHEVNQLIEQGWQPFGGVSMAFDGDDVKFAQAMVIYDDEDN